MPGRSPHRHTTPPPPLISRHSPHRGRGRSPDRHPMEMASSSRGRERREYRPVRRSRSPVLLKSRPSYSPPSLKRKPMSPGRERELSRRRKLSKSPLATRVPSEHRAYADDSHTVRSVSGSDRYRDREYEKEKERALPQFRGPEGTVNFDVSELKKFTIEVIRKPQNETSDTFINRNIPNPDDIVPVRRPDEGTRPLFWRTSKVPPESRTSRDRQSPPDGYRRIVAISHSRSAGRHSPEHSRERARYSSPPYEENRRQYYPERAPSPYEARHRSPPPRKEEYVETREKHRERRAGSREDLRRDLEVRRERRYSHERSSYERDSDLRMRINEKRNEPHSRHEEREYTSRRYESEKGKHERPHYSPPPKEKRQAGSLDRHEGSRSSRGEPWERDGERKRRPHSREREERGREHYEHSGHVESSDRGRRPHSFKTDYEPKKFYTKSYEHKEFIPPPTRGRGGLVPMRRGIPPVMRGRGIIRGIPARGFPLRGVMRGVPRVPFMRGFPPRFFPPY